MSFNFLNSMDRFVPGVHDRPLNELRMVVLKRFLADPIVSSTINLRMLSSKDTLLNEYGSFRYVISYLHPDVERDISSYPPSILCDWLVSTQIANELKYEKKVTIEKFARTLYQHGNLQLAIEQLLQQQLNSN
jgi:hypothetical protein